MLSKDQSQQSSSEPKAGATEIPLMSSDDSIDVAPGGGGTVDDPTATDRKPAGVAELDYLA